VLGPVDFLFRALSSLRSDVISPTKMLSLAQVAVLDGGSFRASLPAAAPPPLEEGAAVPAPAAAPTTKKVAKKKKKVVSEDDE